MRPGRPDQREQLCRHLLILALVLLMPAAFVLNVWWMRFVLHLGAEWFGP